MKFSHDDTTSCDVTTCDFRSRDSNSPPTFSGKTLTPRQTETSRDVTSGHVASRNAKPRLPTVASISPRNRARKLLSRGTTTPRDIVTPCSGTNASKKGPHGRGAPIKLSLLKRQTTDFRCAHKYILIQISNASARNQTKLYRNFFSFFSSSRRV